MGSTSDFAAPPERMRRSCADTAMGSIASSRRSLMPACLSAARARAVGRTARAQSAHRRGSPALIATMALEKMQLRYGLDALGDHLQVPHMAERDDPLR